MGDDDLMLEGLRAVERDLATVKADLDLVRRRIGEVDFAVEEVKSRLGGIEGRLDLLLAGRDAR